MDIFTKISLYTFVVLSWFLFAVLLSFLFYGVFLIGSGLYEAIGSQEPETTTLYCKAANGRVAELPGVKRVKESKTGSLYIELDNGDVIGLYGSYSCFEHRKENP